jgi:hypothetical protein
MGFSPNKQDQPSEVNETLHQDYYEILGVARNASSDKIQEAYLKSKSAYSGESLALYSLMGQEDNQDILQQIELAYSILSVPARRMEYDRGRGIHQDYGSVFSSKQDGIDSRNQFYSSNQHQQLRVENSKILDPNEATFSTPFTQMQPQHRDVGRNNYHQEYGEKVLTPSKGQDYFDQKEYTHTRDQNTDISRIMVFKRFHLEFVRNLSFDQEIENTVHFKGDFLKKIRDYKNVSLDRMSDLTKISRTYLMCIENDDYQKLPAMAYVRGFVYQYAKVLKLNPDLVANSYIHSMKEVLEQGKKK